MMPERTKSESRPLAPRPYRGVAVLVLSAGLPLLLALPAWAAGDAEHHGPSTMDLVWQAVNLAAVLAVIIYLARKPVATFFGDRRTGIKNDIDSAAELLKQSELHFSQWQRKLVDLENEIAGIRDTARSRAEDERDQILAEARDTAERIKRDAVAAVDQELRRAREELRQEAAGLAVDFADELLKESVTDGDRERLLDEFITRVEPGPLSAETGR
jgi:F-type H+-transporting ATPase subunit b